MEKHSHIQKEDAEMMVVRIQQLGATTGDTELLAAAEMLSSLLRERELAVHCIDEVFNAVYNPCYNCPRPNVIRVDEGREAILPKDGGDYYDPLVCPQMCVCGASREYAEKLEIQLRTTCHA